MKFQHQMECHLHSGQNKGREKNGKAKRETKTMENEQSRKLDQTDNSSIFSSVTFLFHEATTVTEIGLISFLNHEIV